MVRSLLLEGVSPQEYQTMRACLGVHEQSFRPDDVIYDFGDGRGLLGIVTEGSAVVERIDREGGRAILEHLEPGGVFGDVLSGSSLASPVTVMASVPCEVLLIPYERLLLSDGSPAHQQTLRNLVRTISD